MQTERHLVRHTTADGCQHAAAVSDLWPHVAQQPVVERQQVSAEWLRHAHLGGVEKAAAVDPALELYVGASRNVW